MLFIKKGRLDDSDLPYSTSKDSDNIYRQHENDNGYVRVMVSLNRQSHIVTEYGKSRNITLHDCSASSLLPRVANQHLAVDPAA
jgi:hypothetical protein